MTMWSLTYKLYYRPQREHHFDNDCGRGVAEMRQDLLVVVIEQEGVQVLASILEDWLRGSARGIRYVDPGNNPATWVKSTSMGCQLNQNMYAWLEKVKMF